MLLELFKRFEVLFPIILLRTSSPVLISAIPALPSVTALEVLLAFSALRL